MFRSTDSDIVWMGYLLSLFVSARHFNGSALDPRGREEISP